MSTFQVQLNNSAQGYLDLNPATAIPYSGGVYSDLGSEIVPSIQRTIFVAGPNNVYRQLKDGQIFTDCNYWKRFAYPQVSLDQAFIVILNDDGSIYSDNPSENTYPKVYSLTVSNGSVFADNLVDIFGDTGSYSSFVQITNQGMTAVNVKINGNSGAIFELNGGDTQIFSNNDLAVSMLEFSNNVSGGSSSNVQVIVSVRSICRS